MITKSIIILIRGYQKTFSPDHGLLRCRFPFGYCRYFPTCSEYAIQTIKTYGVSRGVWYAFKRVLRCHPWARSGIDLVPKKEIPNEKENQLH